MTAEHPTSYPGFELPQDLPADGQQAASHAKFLLWAMQRSELAAPMSQILAIYDNVEVSRPGSPSDAA